MPNRMLRDWTESDKINSLSVYSERFFTRLIMKVDDYGCFHADIRLLKANLFPLLIDTVREADLLRWMAECQKAGLIVLYERSSKKYLQILDFKQRLDKAKSKYPLPETVNGLPEVVNDYPAEVEVEKKEKRSETRALENSNLFRKPNIPTKQQVWEVFSRQGGTKEMAKKFYETNQAVEWFYKGSPIMDFSNFVPGFISNWNKYEKSTPVENYEPGKLSDTVKEIEKQEKLKNQLNGTNKP